jgi:glycosyltransferase involved in cell wall biosynthesis
MREFTDRSQVVVKPNFAWDRGVGEGGKGYALCIGRITPEKGTLQLAHDWIATSVRLELRIVGDGPQRSAVEQIARADSRVRLLGHLDLDQVGDLLAGADALVVPWLWNEPFGRVIPEALSRGTPIVTNDLSSSRSATGEGAHVSSYRAGDPVSLTTAVSGMVDGSRRARRRAARNHYEEHFTPERNLRMLQVAYGVLPP